MKKNLTKIFSRFQPLVWIKNNWCKSVAWGLSLLVVWLGATEYEWQKQNHNRAVSIVILTVFITLFSAIQRHFDKRKKQLLNDSLAESMPSVIRNYVIGIYENMGLGTDDRITLYLYNDNSFLPCARFSRNPSYKGIQRPSYGTDRGVIDKIWTQGWFFDNEFPDPSDKKRYYEYSRDKYKYSKREIENLSMKARFYCGIRIEDSLHRDCYAMIIIESMNPDCLSKEAARDMLLREQKALVPLLENKTIRDIIPNQSIVGKEEGF